MTDQDDLVVQLLEAVEHRTGIGIAMGIVMERLDVERDEAFPVLRDLSSRSNRKLHEIAAEMSSSRQLADEWLDRVAVATDRPKADPAVGTLLDLELDPELDAALDDPTGAPE